MGSVGNKSSVDKQRLAGYKKTLDDNFKHYEHEGYDIYKVGNQYAAYDFNKEYTPEQLKKIKSVADVAVEYGKTLKELKSSLSAARSATQSKISGNVSFAEIVKASDNKVTFDKFNTATLNHTVIQTKKGEIGDVLNQYGITEFVGNMYRDKSGANDLKRIQDAGFEVVATYKGKPQGEIPARDYYYFKKKRG